MPPGRLSLLLRDLCNSLRARTRGVIVSRPPAGASPFHTPRDQPLRDCSTTIAPHPHARTLQFIPIFIFWVSRARPARATQMRKADAHIAVCIGIAHLCRRAMRADFPI
jgi:hypothetical protein